MNTLIAALSDTDLASLDQIPLTKSIINALSDEDLSAIKITPTKALLSSISNSLPPNINAQIINISSLPALTSALTISSDIISHLASTNRSLSGIDQQTINDLLYKYSDTDNIPITTYLIQQGASISAPNPTAHYRCSPLHRASFTCSNRTINTIKLFLTHNPNLNVQDIDGDTPLHLAASSNNTTIVKLLINAGASETITNRRGQTYLDKMSPAAKAELTLDKAALIQQENATLRAKLDALEKLAQPNIALQQENAVLREKLASLKSALD